MALTRTQARTDLLRRLGNRPDADTASLDHWLNDGLLDLATSRLTFRSLESVGTPVASQVGVAAYPLPTGAFTLLYLVDTVNKKVLRPWEGTFQALLEAQQVEDAASPETPALFTIFGNSFYVYRTPQVATISWTPYVYLRPTWDAAAGAVPSIEDEWHYAITISAAEHAFKDLGDDERAAAAVAELDTWLSRRDTARRLSARRRVPGQIIRPDFSGRDPRTGV